MPRLSLANRHHGLRRSLKVGITIHWPISPYEARRAKDIAEELSCGEGKSRMRVRQLTALLPCFFRPQAAGPRAMVLDMAGPGVTFSDDLMV